MKKGAPIMQRLPPVVVQLAWPRRQGVPLWQGLQAPVIDRPPYVNVGNGGPVRIDGSAAEEGGTKLYLVGNWGPRCSAGCANDWIGHGVNTWDYYELNRDGSTHLVNYLNELAGDPIP